VSESVCVTVSIKVSAPTPAALCQPGFRLRKPPAKSCLEIPEGRMAHAAKRRCTKTLVSASPNCHDEDTDAPRLLQVQALRQGAYRNAWHLIPGPVPEGKE
jgi:hypothetical protein